MDNSTAPGSVRWAMRLVCFAIIPFLTACERNSASASAHQPKVAPPDKSVGAPRPSAESPAPVPVAASAPDAAAVSPPKPGTRFAIRGATPGVAAGFVAAAERTSLLALTDAADASDFDLMGKDAGALLREIATATDLEVTERAGHHVLARREAIERLRSSKTPIPKGGHRVDFMLLDADAGNVFRLLSGVLRLKPQGAAAGKLTVVSRGTPSREMLGVLCALSGCSVVGAQLRLPDEGNLPTVPERPPDDRDCAMRAVVARCEPLNSLRVVGVGPLGSDSVRALIRMKDGYDVARHGDFVSVESQKIDAIDATGVVFESGKRLTWGT